MNATITQIPNDVQTSIERYLSTYGDDGFSIERMADMFTGSGLGAFDGTTYTPYPPGTKENAIRYIRARTNRI